MREGTQVRNVPACLSVFRIGTDGKLAFVRKYDVDVGNNTSSGWGWCHYKAWRLGDTGDTSA